MVSRLGELTATNEYLSPNRIQDKTIYDTEDIIDKTTETKKDSVMYNITVINQKSLECKNIFIDSLNSEVYKLKKPIPICIEYDGKTYIANNYDLGLYGYDDMELEAIEDLKKSIIECYEDLKTETELSPILKRMMVCYKEIIEEK
jgi:hypothetical protein